ncbi:LCP family protein [Streptomyces sp. MI02-7b]|uniref:LCP family protein n=1 Tax=Streptomyces sp. MI02-7b TaxID=462941 RepID=UPI0029AC68D7|nr:LCP family protein [Streptomyces sp. MI02-7b]MDX3074782.1 LCP family protein [Streptomyces sp. MI02-7b]
MTDRGVRDLGWDDSLYETRPQHEADAARTGPPAPGAPDGGRAQRAAGTRRRRGRRALRWTAVVLALLILGTAGAGYAYYQHLSHNIRKGKRNSGASNVHKAPTNALNILLLGSDSRNTDANLKLGGAKYTRGDKPRADVIMLVHVSADRSNMSVVSIPRDTRVPIPKCTDPKTGETFPATTHAIINESLTHGGPGCTLATVQNLTGVYIDHWMMIDFAGVVKMADAVGGVEVCVRQNVWDHPTPDQPGGSGLKLKAGRQKIYGKTALQWLRTRHAFESDLGRAEAQHMYMNSMVRELRSQNVFTDSGRLRNLAEAATKALQVSEEIGTPKKLYDLGMELKSVPSKRITMLTMPPATDPENDQHYIPDAVNAPRVWAKLVHDVPFDDNGAKKPPKKPAESGPPARPAADIPVAVVNGTAGDSTGTPVNGRAGVVAGLLAGQGFTGAVKAAEAQPSATTAIAYPAAQGAQARSDALAVAKALKLPAGLVKESSHVASVTLVVGADWREGTAYAGGADPDAKLPDSAGALNGSDKSTCMPVYAPYRWQ